MTLRSLCALCVSAPLRFKTLSLAALLTCVSLIHVGAQSPATPKPPIVNDPALKIELLAAYPDVEACTTVCGAPDGSIYVGNDPRDGRLNTSQPVNTILRFGPPGPDGKRQRTVFADKIYSPAGSAWHDGYLYVLHDPLLTRFKDTDGDGVADLREDLVANLGIKPNEGLNDHVVSGFTLGMDGFFYISVGDRGIYQATSAKDQSTITMQGGGIARCRTDGTQLEVFSTGTRNHLQVNLDAEDNAFTRDNTDDGNGWWTRLTHHIEGGYYGYPYDYRKAVNYGVLKPSEQTLNAIKQHGGTTVPPAEVISNQKSVISDAAEKSSLITPSGLITSVTSAGFLPAMADFGGGSPTGGLCYLSDGLPEQYRGKHFFSEWGKAGIFVTEVKRRGATFEFVSDTKLVEPDKGGDFRPMQISVAADGSILIADWGYGGWKSPRTAGAIWRLYWPAAKPAPRLKDESKASVDEVITALGHPDRDQRLRAQTALIGRGTNYVEQTRIYFRLVDLAEGKGATSSLQRIHALWASSILYGQVPHDADWITLPRLLKKVAESADHSLRAQAVTIGGHYSGMPYLEDTFVRLTSDPDPDVRRRAVTVLGGEVYRLNNRDSDPAPVLKALSDSDSWVRFAARRALEHTANWEKAAVALDASDPVARETAWTAIQNSYNEGALTVVLQKAGGSDAGDRARAVGILGRIAYQPQPYDGHWWGTQPVKSAPPLNSVVWSGTPRALGSLMLALADSDTGVRLAAAKAFSAFTLGGPRSGASQTPGAVGQSGEAAAATALRNRLTAETDATVRRQLIESLGVQKDPQAMDVFRQIALDEKADAEFRDTAIGAIVNIGGDGAKQTITQLAAASLSPAAARKIITAAGELKVLDAAPALIARLKDADAGNREAAAVALKQLGPKSNAGPALIEALSDKEGKVQAAAVDALGSYRERAALPGIIALLEKKKHLRETTGALALMPDESAIPVLVETLRDKNTTFRRNAIKALKTMRDKARPQVDALLTSGRVPEELIPEIKNAFDSGALTKWKMVGVFENVWEAVHPPEKDALALKFPMTENPTGNIQVHPEPGQLAALFKQRYHNAEGKDVGWIDVTADSDVGRVDLDKVFKSTAMVCAYAITEIDADQAADAKLFTSADDEIAVWLNGQRVLNQPGNHGYDPDRNETPIKLAGGKNTLFVKIGNKGGAWVFHARIPGFDNGKFTKPKDALPDEKQRLFALATKPDGTYANPGNAKNGEKLFFDQTAPLGGICATCHAINGKGGQIGPDLSAIAANYKRPDLITSIHEPSKTIALGFEQVMVETKTGETIAGALRQEAADALTIVSADAQSHTVKKADIKTNTHIPTSLMPAGLTLGLKPQDFVDLLAFLETLKGK